MKKIIFTFGLLISSSAFAINPDHEYMEFFKKYEKFSNTVDPNLVDLYADDAKLSVTTKNDDGMESSVKMTGKKMKEMYIANIENLRGLDYTSKFNNIKLLQDKKNIKITATRYDYKKCINDNEYYMIITRSPNNKLAIIEENISTVERSTCKGSMKDDLALQLSLGANILSKKLPMQIDSETIFEKIEAHDKELSMNYRLIHLTEDDLPKNIVEMNVVPQMIKGLCGDAKMRELLDKGAKINLRYYYPDTSPILEIKMTQQDCSI